MDIFHEAYLWYKKTLCYDINEVIHMDAAKCGQFIQILCKERNLTQTELADLLQVTNKAISRWETGEGFPDVMMLPKLAEILNVTVDELLDGRRILKSSNISKFRKQRLTNVSLIVKSILLVSFIMFLALSYITFKVWIGVLAFSIPSIFSMVWLLVERNNYKVFCEFDDEDKFILFNQLRSNVSIFVMLFVMMLPQIVEVSKSGNWANGVVPLNQYLLVAFPLGIIAFLTCLFYFYYISHKQNVKMTFSKVNKVNYGMWLSAAFYMLIFAMTNLELYLHVYVLFVYLTIGFVLYFKRIDKLIFTMTRILIVVLFTTCILFAYQDSTGIIYTIFILSYIVLFVFSLVMFLVKIIRKQKDSYLFFSYHNLLALLYTFLIGLFFIPNGTLYVIANIGFVLFGILFNLLIEKVILKGVETKNGMTIK